MLIKADPGNKATLGTGVPENDKFTLADSDSSKMDSAIERVNVLTVELKVVTHSSMSPIEL